MSRVLIRHKHNKSQDELHRIITDIQEMLQSGYHLDTRWRGDDAMEFQRPGLSGELSMEPGCLVIKMKLGIMLSIYSRTIQTKLEQAITQKLADPRPLNS